MIVSSLNQQGYIPNSTKREHVGLRHKVQKTTGSCNEDIASFLKFFPLKPRRSTTINNTWAQHGTVTQSAGLVEDLGSELAGGTHDQNQRLGSNCICRRVEALGSVGTGCGELACLSHQFGKNWNQKSRGFARS
jgi:hypothetical protein